MNALRHALTIGCLLLASPASAAKTEPKEEPAPAAGVLLGDFMIRDIRATEGLKVRLSFKLYAEVRAEIVKPFEEYLEQRKHRVRGEVITAIRTAEQSEFQDPDLQRLRRRVLLRIRRTEPLLPIDRLLIGEFEYFTD